MDNSREFRNHSTSTESTGRNLNPLHPHPVRRTYKGIAFTKRTALLSTVEAFSQTHNMT
jgi:hypothetical protein